MTRRVAVLWSAKDDLFAAVPDDPPCLLKRCWHHFLAEQRLLCPVWEGWGAHINTLHGLRCINVHAYTHTFTH